MTTSRHSQLTTEQQLYADLMDEARLRINAIREILDNRNRWAPRLLQEFCYLQLRMLCETIAIGCLIAHGDVKNQSTLKSWKPPDIINKLSELNPDFYPKGIRFQKGVGELHLSDYPVPQLSKDELVRLWKRSGAYLHRGTAKGLLSNNHKKLEVQLGIIIQYAQKVINLLEQHIISSADKKKHLLVALASEDSGGRAMVWYASHDSTQHSSQEQ